MQLRNNSALQNGKYQIIRVLGQGGFGITYLAENLLLDKKVAIKEFFPKEYCDRDSTSRLTLGTQNNAETVGRLKDRFLKEAKNIAKLDHPGIIRIHDVFEENNTAYYVMDYLEGENLNEMVKRNGPMSEAKAIEYIRKVGDALDYIHSRNMTHFDVKPANIMVRRSDDMPVLIDFGLSKQYDNKGDATSALMNAVSPGYSPIELYNPESITTFSPQTDVYSLGATLYYLLTGKVPPVVTELIYSELSFSGSCLKTVKESIIAAMQINRLNRPKTIIAFLNQLQLDSYSEYGHKKSEDTITVDCSGMNSDKSEDTITVDCSGMNSHNRSSGFVLTKIDKKTDRSLRFKFDKNKDTILLYFLCSLLTVILFIMNKAYYLYEGGVYSDIIYVVGHPMVYKSEMVYMSGDNIYLFMLIGIFTFLMTILTPGLMVLMKDSFYALISLVVSTLIFIWIIDSVGLWLVDKYKLTCIVPLVICYIILIVHMYKTNKSYVSNR